MSLAGAAENNGFNAEVFRKARPKRSAHLYIIRRWTEALRECGEVKDKRCFLRRCGCGDRFECRPMHFSFGSRCSIKP